MNSNNEKNRITEQNLFEANEGAPTNEMNVDFISFNRLIISTRKKKPERII